MTGIIFDFNGTLFFDNPKHQVAWGAIAKEIRGSEVSQEELQTKLNGVPNQVIIQYLMGNKPCEKKDITYYSSLKESYYRKFCQEDKESFHLVSGAPTFLSDLKQHQVPMTIASASIKENIDFFVQSFHLDDWFDVAKIVYDDGTYENKQAMFLRAAALIGVDISDCYVFEDSLSGITNAYAVGVKKIIAICNQEKANTYRSLPGVIGCIADFNDPILKQLITY